MLLQFLFDLIYFNQKYGNQRTLPLSVAEYLRLKIKNILNNWVLKSQKNKKLYLLCIAFLKWIKIQQVQVSSLHLKFALQSKNEMLSDVEAVGGVGGRVSECSGRLVFIFLFLKTIGFGS